MGRVPASPDRPVNGKRAKLRVPWAPDLPADLKAGVLPGDDLDDDAVHLCLAFEDADLSGRDATNAEIDQCRYNNVNFSQSRLRRAIIRDAVFASCDLANLRARDSSMSRASISGSRMTGLTWLDGGFRDVTFDGCRMDMVSFRQSTLKDVVFTDCRLSQADFGDADLRSARFVDCDLGGAQFSGAQMAGARLLRCELTGISGVTSLRGAIVTSADAMALAFTLAGALGIVIEDD
jgi:uncharacterized protein YjbI with pentapeptide repeats